MLVSIGSGVSMIKVSNSGHFERVSGIWLAKLASRFDWNS
jgi:pantothenate kinase